MQIVGKQKAGKTQVTLDLALSVANESVEDWYGYKLKHGPVYYGILEGTAFFHRRVEAWLTRNGGNLDKFYVWDKPLSLASQTDLMDLALGVREKPALVVIDSQYMATQGLNENDAEDMGVVFGNLVWLSKTLETVVIPVHHTGLTVTDRARGHSVQAASVQATLVVQKGTKRCTIKVTDVREAEEPEEPFYFRVESVELDYKDENGPVCSAVAVHETAPATVFFLPEYAAYRTYGRTFLNLLKTFPLPQSGMVFYVPKITTPTEAVTQASENGSISTQDLASEYVSGTLQTLVTNLNVSQQYLDRVGPGLAGDQLVQQDQTAQLNRALNIYAYTSLLQKSSVGTLAYTDATGTQAPFNGQAVSDYRQSLAKAAIAIQTTDGTVAYPTAFVTDVNIAESILAAYDSSYRPFVVPQGVAFNPLAVGDYLNNPEGFTGFSFGGLPLVKDQALYVAAGASSFAGSGATGSGSAVFDTDSGNHLGVVGAFDLATVWLESSPVYRVLPQPGAATLTVLIQQYTYCALVVPYPTGVQVISSKATASSTLTTVL